MDRLYAPWRTEYVSGKKIQGCVFCHIVENSDKDEELGVLHREDDFFIVMNKYPYSVGHFMIIPNIHTDKLEELDSDTWMRMNKFAQQGVKLLKEVLNAQGVNLGMNLGKVGGAGIAEHIHLHLVPRWMGDTNFITSIGDTRVYSTDFDKIYKKLKEKAKDYFAD
ncbi:MAG TPA: HIT domain-containing protein [Arcobacter sp.]|jgi:diadenosine tetraphosphate (Ap4A) HIT family hydrolase|nr:HIT domain-containing protein [Arcobacter sp.]